MLHISRIVPYMHKTIPWYNTSYPKIKVNNGVDKPPQTSKDWEYSNLLLLLIINNINYY